MLLLAAGIEALPPDLMDLVEKDILTLKKKVKKIVIAKICLFAWSVFQ